MTATEFSPRMKAAARQYSIEYIDTVRYCLIREFFRRLHLCDEAHGLILRGSFLVRLLTDTIGKERSVDLLYIDAPYDISVDDLYRLTEKILTSEQLHSEIELSLLSVQELEEQKCYKGFSINLLGCIGSVKLGFKINIGLNDVLYHEAETTELPPITQDEPSVECLTYPVEEIIAEKLDILLRRFELDRPMRHLYDIYELSYTFDFDGYELQKAVRSTLEHRKNDCNFERLKQIGTLHDDESMLMAWQHFKRINNYGESFETVLTRVLNFLEPIWNSIKQEKRWSREWSATSGRWNDPMYLY